MAALVLRIRIQWFERESLFRRDAHQQQAEGVGHREADFLQRRGSFPFGPFVDASANDGIGSHGINHL